MNQVSKTVGLGTYPYTYARVSVMKTALLKKDDYDKLMKMTQNELIGFLQGTTYKKEINELAMKFSGSKLVEVALNRNLENVFAKLRAISKNGLLQVINAYLMRYDIESLKTVLRSKYVGLEDAEELLLAAGSLKREFFISLLKEKTIEDVLIKNSLIDFAKIKPAYDRFKDTRVLGELENVFDKYYYDFLFELAAKLPRQGKLFGDFLRSEIEVMNIVNVLRLKRAGVDQKDAVKYLLPAGGLMRKRLMELLNAEITEVQRILGNTKYGRVMEPGLASLQATGSLIELENKLKTYLLNKTKLLVHQHPLSVDVLLGYMFAKDIEIRNLKTLLRGKQLGVDDSFIESQLVV